MGADGVVEKIVQRPKALDPQMMEKVSGAVAGGPNNNVICKDDNSLRICAEDRCCVTSKQAGFSLFTALSLLPVVSDAC